MFFMSNFMPNWIFIILGILLSVITFGFTGVFVIFLLCGFFIFGVLLAFVKNGLKTTAELANEFDSFDYSVISKGILLNTSIKAEARDLEQKIIGSAAIDSNLQEILNFALRDFIEVWYSSLTNDAEFTKSLRVSASKVLSKIGTNLKKVDWMSFFTRHLVDDFASHIRLYRLAKEKFLNEKLKNQPNGGSNTVDDLETHFFDFELEMEKDYCRDLVSTSTQYENAYLHDLADVLLYLLLPSEEFKCKPSRLLIREMFVKKLIHPIINQFSDPDYVYQTIIWLLTDVPLRYEDFLTIVQSCDDLEELQALQESIEHEITVQRSKDTGGKDDLSVKQQLSSLFYVLRLVKIKSRRLREGVDEADAISDDYRFSESGDNCLFYDLSLEFVLNNTLALSFFIEYLSSAGGTDFLDMFLSITGFKVSVDHMIVLAKEEEGERAYLRKEKIETAREAAFNIFHQYLGEEVTSRVALEDNVIKRLYQNIKNKDTPEVWFEETHIKLFEVLEQDVRFFPTFKRSDLYLRLLAELKLLPVDDGDNKSDEVDRTFAAEDALDCVSLKSADSGGSYETSSIKSDNDNSNFPATSYSAKINTIAIGNEDNRPFAMYNITVNKYNQKGEITATWNVLRRYSDFYALHVLIQQKFPALRFLSFPAKKAFNNLSRDLLDKRKQTLNQYIKMLLLPETLRQNKNLETTMLDFLRLKDYGGDKPSISNRLSTFVTPFKTGVKSFGSAVISVPDALMDGVVRVGDNLGKVTKSVLGEEITASNIFNANFVASFMPDRLFENPLLKPFWRKLDANDSMRALNLVGSNGMKTNAIANPEGRVGATLDSESADNIPIRILLLFMDEVFGLRKRNQWFRRRLVAFLHQFIHAAFGTSINRRIFDFVSWLTCEEQVSEYIKAFKNSFWPNGVLSEVPPPRPSNVQMRTRLVAKVKLLSIVPDELRLFIGNETTTQGISLVFEALLNPHLNRRFVYVLLERFLLTVFPKNRFNEIFPKLHSKSPRCAASRLS